MKLASRYSAGFFLAAVLLAGNGSAQTTLYSEDFNGSSLSTLIGTSPDTRPGAEVWGGTTSITANGAFNNSSGAYLPITLAAGNIYQLTVTIQTASSWNGWMAAGFIAGNPTVVHNGVRFADNGAYDWFLIHHDARLQYFRATALTGQINPSTNPQNKELVFTVTIDASDSTPANWLLSGSLVYDGNTYLPWPDVGGGPITAGITSLSQITGFGFGSQGGAGTVQDLSLTITAVPEPSTYAAIFGGLALTGAVLRRRRLKA